MGIPFGVRVVRWSSVTLTCLLFSYHATADLLPFPLTAGQRGNVTCLDHPEIPYDVYLPPGYSTNGPPLPIFFSISSGGGGMNGVFQSALQQSNIIGIGLIASRDGEKTGTTHREGWAVLRDLRKRVLFDPTAIMAGGISGGGTAAYWFTQLHAQHVSGLMEMAGSFGVVNGHPYPSTARVQTNLYVAWTIGDQDGIHNLYPWDSAFVTNTCGGYANLWTFSGGHVAPPTDVQLQCFAYMLTNRVMPGPTDQADSQTQAADWRARLANGDNEAVLRECVATIMNRPRSWFAHQAQIVLDDMESNYETFRTINIDNIAQGDFAQDMFYYTAYGAGYAYDPNHYYSSLRGMTGVTGSSGDQSANAHSLLLNFGWPTPKARWSFEPLQNLMTLFTYKDAPGLTYLLQSRTNFSNDLWSTRPEVPFDTNTLWSTTVDHNNGAPLEFYRLKAQIIYATNQIPLITGPPASQTAYLGTTTTLVVSTSGTGPFGYQWRKNGFDMADIGNVSGSETSTLTLRNLTAGDGASYDVAVMGYTSVTSSPPAVLTVVPFDPTQLPTITTQPLSLTNYEGLTVSFNVAVNGTGPFGYQWRKNGVELNDGGNVAGSITPTLTLFNVSQLDTATYDVVVMGYTNAISDPATLTVVPFPATLLLYEPFDYTNVGGLVTVNNPNNWRTGGSGTNDTGVTSGSLSWPGLAASIGNSATNGGAGMGVRRLMPTGVSSGQVFFSALFRINDFGSWDQLETQAGALTASDNNSFRLQVIVEGKSGGYVFGVQKGGTGSTPTYDTTVHSVGDTVFLVGKYDFSTTPNTATLWINPDPTTFSSPAPDTNHYIVSTAGPDNLVIDRFNMRQISATKLPANLQWDELRVGLSWADVTPTPF